MDDYTAALMRERAFYIQQGRPERAVDVEAELERVGIDAPGIEAVIAVLAGGSPLENAAAPAAPETAV